MNTQVDFPVAKMLKEKGFNEPCRWYMEDGVTLSESNETNDYLFPSYYSAPTIAEVVMWLYEKHSIWIYVSDNSARLGFRYQIQRLKILGENNFSSDVKFETPTEAYSQAIIYTLKNLI